MMNIFAKYRVRPSEGASMMRVNGDYSAEVSLDIGELSAKERRELIAELRTQGLNAEVHGNTLKVSGPVTFLYSRGNDNQGRRSIWLQAEGAIANLIAEFLFLIYQERGWLLSSGRVFREIIARTGGEIKLPDGHTIFLGSSDEYQSSVLCSDGSYVHPKLGDELKRLIADSDDVIDVDEDPFK